MENTKIRVNRTIETNLLGDICVIYTIEEKFGSRWEPVSTFSSRRKFSKYWHFFRKMEKEVRFGDWETNPEL